MPNVRSAASSHPMTSAHSGPAMTPRSLASPARPESEFDTLTTGEQITPSAEQGFSDNYLTPSAGISDYFSDYSATDGEILDVEGLSRWMTSGDGAPLQYVDPSAIENRPHSDQTDASFSSQPSHKRAHQPATRNVQPMSPESLGRSSPGASSIGYQTDFAVGDPQAEFRSGSTSQRRSHTSQLASDGTSRVSGGDRTSGATSLQRVGAANSALSPPAQSNQARRSSPHVYEDSRESRQGLAPNEREVLNETAIPSLADQEKDRKLSETAAGVRKWLVQGKLVEEDEDDEIELWDELEISRTPTPPISHDLVERGIAEVTSNPNRERKIQWHEPPFDPETDSLGGVPISSKAAMERFAKKVRDQDAVSVAATYASSTRRRMSDGDMMSVRSATGISQRPSLASQGGKDPRRESQASSILHNFLTKFTSNHSDSSRAKRKEIHNSDRQISFEESRSNSSESVHTVTKTPSWPKPKPHPENSFRPGLSPHNSQSSSHGEKHPHRWNFHPIDSLLEHRRHRSRSDLPPNTQRSALGNLWHAHGGPPVPKLNRKREDGSSAGHSPLEPASVERFPEPQSSILDKSAFPPFTQGMSDLALGNDEDEDEDQIPSAAMRESGIDTSDYPLTATVEGFGAHIRRLNPAIEDFLADRIGHEQMKRYKVLVSLRRAHNNAVANGACESGSMCSRVGGPVILEPRSSKGSEAGAAIFQVSANTPVHEIQHLQGDETAQLAGFPDGIPLPPVKQLPAQFECPLCFKVKKIMKPSDWSKHCYEDLYPFVCSFPDCAEPKAFNRKADWARHESERHLKLETWTCNFHECIHSCHRRDNFVQHLVRAHRIQEEPRPQGTRRKTVHDDSEVSRLAEQCRTETDKIPEEETCRFCGNHCNTWKKFAVHVAKHLVQVSLPMLRLIDQEIETPRSGMNVVMPLNAFDATAGSAYGFGNQQRHVADFRDMGSSRDSSATVPDRSTPLTQDGLTLNAYSTYALGQAYRGFSGPMQPIIEQNTSHTFPGTKNLPRQPSPNPYADNGPPTYEPTSYPSQYDNRLTADLSTSPGNAPANSLSVSTGPRTPSTYPGAYTPSEQQVVAGQYGQYVPSGRAYDDDQAFVSSPLIDNNNFSFESNIPNSHQYNNPKFTLQQQQQVDAYRNANGYPNATYNESQYSDNSATNGRTFDNQRQYLQYQHQIQQLRQMQVPQMQVPQTQFGNDQSQYQKRNRRQ